MAKGITIKNIITLWQSEALWHKGRRNISGPSWKIAYDSYRLICASSTIILRIVLLTNSLIQPRSKTQEEKLKIIVEKPCIKSECGQWICVYQGTQIAKHVFALQICQWAATLLKKHLLICGRILSKYVWGEHPVKDWIGGKYCLSFGCRRGPLH